MMRSLLFSTLLGISSSLVAQVPDIRPVEIPADSSKPYDFRGEPDWDYPAYQALYKAATYGELLMSLEAFFVSWTKDGAKLEKPNEITAYYNCKQAAIRLLYLTGDIESADRFLVELHPDELVQGDEAEKMLAANAQKEKIRRIGDELRVVLKDLTGEEPYPDGIPDSMPELYRPLLEVLKDLGN